MFAWGSVGSIADAVTRDIWRRMRIAWCPCLPNHSGWSKQANNKHLFSSSSFYSISSYWFPTTVVYPRCAQCAVWRTDCTCGFTSLDVAGKLTNQFGEMEENGRIEPWSDWWQPIVSTFFGTHCFARNKMAQESSSHCKGKKCQGKRGRQFPLWNEPLLWFHFLELETLKNHQTRSKKQ